MKTFVAVILFSALIFGQLDTTITKTDSILVVWQKRFVENVKAIKKMNDDLANIKKALVKADKDQAWLDASWQARYLALLQEKNKIITKKKKGN